MYPPMNKYNKNIQYNTAAINYSEVHFIPCAIRYFAAISRHSAAIQFFPTFLQAISITLATDHLTIPSTCLLALKDEWYTSPLHWWRGDIDQRGMGF